jgi:glycosyltransferase involved in cell wall biosynthesis
VKVAFVNQPFDRVTPPGQTSVGLCTFGLTESLKRHCESIVYGSKEKHAELGISSDGTIGFRFLPSSLRDRLRFKLRQHTSRLLDLRSPVSTAGWLYRDYAEAVAKDIRAQRPDIILLQQCSQFAPVIRKYNPTAKVVLHLHAPWYSQSDPKAMVRRLKNVDLVTTVSDFVTSRVSPYAAAVGIPCRTVYNGICPKDYPGTKAYAEQRARKVRRILFVGAVSPHSGVHVLIDAFRMVEAHLPDVQLTVVGHQVDYPKEEVFDQGDPTAFNQVSEFYRKGTLANIKHCFIRSEAQSVTYTYRMLSKLPPSVAKKINFTGGIDDRAELTRSFYEADVFAFPPVCEHGFGLSPVEAMASGTAVVASRSGGVVETVVHGQTGLLVPQNDPHTFAEALLTLLENDGLRESMGKAGRARALTQFTWDVAAERTYALFRELLQTGNASVAARSWQFTNDLKTSKPASHNTLR